MILKVFAEVLRYNYTPPSRVNLYIPGVSYFSFNNDHPTYVRFTVTEREDRLGLPNTKTHR